MKLKLFLQNLKNNYKWRRYFISENCIYVYTPERFDDWGSDDGKVHKRSIFQLIKRSYNQTINGYVASNY